MIHGASNRCGREVATSMSILDELGEITSNETAELQGAVAVGRRGISRRHVYYGVAPTVGATHSSPLTIISSATPTAPKALV